MKFLDLGYATLDVAEIKMIYEPNSVPIRAFVSAARKLDEEAVKRNPLETNRKFLNLTFGSAANSYIELKDGRILSTGFPLRALQKRIKEI